MYYWGFFRNLDFSNDENGQLYKVVIITDWRNNSQTVGEELVLNDSPFTVEYSVEDDIYKPYKCSTATIGILQEESGLSDTARTFDTDHTVVPINLIHQNATNWCVRMLDKVSMCPEKSFHSCLICFRLLYKVVQRYTISCKLQSLNSKIFVKSVIFLISK